MATESQNGDAGQLLKVPEPCVNVCVDCSDNTSARSTNVSESSVDIQLPDSPQPLPSHTNHSGSCSELSVGSVESSADVQHLPTHESLHEAESLVISRLQQQLSAAQAELSKKNEKCVMLTHMQTTVDNEIHELTQSLFAEAYKIANAAQSKQMKAERLLFEANLKIDGLQAEVDALKLLVLHNTPSNSNNSSPRGRPPSANGETRSKLSTFLGHRRNNSDSASTPNLCNKCNLSDADREKMRQLDTKEVDPIFHKEFTAWRATHDLTAKDKPFLKRVYQDELLPCIFFENVQLMNEVLTAIENNCIEIETTNEEKPIMRTCALTCVPRLCPFKVRCSAESQWYYVSNMCRNRIAAVCDFFTYLRYLQQGIIKCGLHDAYWRVIALRKNMAMAKLGMGIIPTGGRQSSP